MDAQTFAIIVAVATLALVGALAWTRNRDETTYDYYDEHEILPSMPRSRGTDDFQPWPQKQWIDGTYIDYPLEEL